MAKAKRGGVSTRRNVKSQRTETALTVHLNKKLWADAESVLEGRGLTLDAFVGMHLRALMTAQKAARALELDDEMPIGKYRGERVEIVLRTEPKYVAWLLEKVEGFRLSPEATGLLIELTDGEDYDG